MKRLILAGGVLAVAVPAWAQFSCVNGTAWITAPYNNTSTTVSTIISAPVQGSGGKGELVTILRGRTR